MEEKALNAIQNEFQDFEHHKLDDIIQKQAEGHIDSTLIKMKASNEREETKENLEEMEKEFNKDIVSLEHQIDEKIKEKQIIEDKNEEFNEMKIEVQHLSIEYEQLLDELADLQDRYNVFYAESKHKMNVQTVLEVGIPLGTVASFLSGASMFFALMSIVIYIVKMCCMQPETTSTASDKLND